ncbi:MAG TPA: hypothetical protein VFT29_14620 [Gemmatimonadaceae bacterium]|nr:hypothetical protein [Gemmatimonadaceae bacterium]
MRLLAGFTPHRVEVAAAVLMGAAALATSWSGYESTLWNGEQAKLNGRTSAMRTCATRAAMQAGQVKTVDVVLFLSWWRAAEEGHEALRAAHEKRFRDEFKPAFEAWIAMHPQSNPSAPSTPFAMPQYRVAYDAEADRCDRESIVASEAAQRANDLGDRYILTSVIFAVVLFFTGATQSIEGRRARLFVFAFGVAAFVVGLASLVRLPVH